MDRSKQREAQAEGVAIVSPHDQITRSARLEANITETVVSAFQSPVGTALLDYLKSVTLFRVLPPGAPDAHLRELEGQRRLVAGLMSRIQADDRRRRNATAQKEV
jgi:hypothetical protein